jgi:hypothetical protein
MVGLLFSGCSSGGSSEVSVGTEQFSSASVPQSDDLSEEVNKHWTAHGQYCARVHYSNPRSGTESDYFLTVEADQGSLVQINWPDGGHLDTDHFHPAPIGQDSTVAVTTHDGLAYRIVIIGNPEDCQSHYSTRVQCKGITRSGSRCRRTTDNANGYCFQHQPR